MASSVDQSYRYLRPSQVDLAPGRPDVRLATSGGITSAGDCDHPYFFNGFLGHAEQAAAGLLAVAKVARTRFYTPPGMLATTLRAADPVVTSNGDLLRFESFSACCGVYARLDVLPGGLDGPALDTGTTNVDFNPPMRDALAHVGGIEPLHLRVGDDVVVTTLDASVTERKVPLPARWLKGFAEVQLAGAAMRPVLEVNAAEARRFLNALPPRSASRTAPLFAAQASHGIRLTSRPGTDTVSVAGPERLRVLLPLLRFARRLRAYGPRPGTGQAASIWELDLDDARLAVTLSPDLSRGFSGEGGVLWDLADGRAAADADMLSTLLAFERRIDVTSLARQAALPPDRVLRAMAHLGAAGRVGYDAFEGAYFHRELPFSPDALRAMHPRLRDARALVDERKVRLVGDTGYVSSGDAEHIVRCTPAGDRCTCPWYGKYHNSRGPCKHVLAVALARADEHAR